MGSPYKFMRLILFFDLPMITKEERRTYTRFRKYLIENGFIMLQLSVYAKIFPNRIALFQYTDTLKRYLPNEGSIRIMSVTEKQYAQMLLLVGGKSLQEEMITEDPLVVL